MRTFVLGLALAPIALAVPDAVAAPERTATKVPAARVVPRKKLVKAKQIEPMVPVGPPDLEWHAPPGTPFEGPRKVTPKAWVAGPAAVTLYRAQVRINTSPTQADGFYFDGSGSIGIEIPASAIGGKNLLLSCKGELPSSISAYAVKQTASSYTMWSLGSFTPYKKKEVALVLVHDDFAPDSLVEIAIGVWPGSDVGKWRVDECSIQRVE